MAAWLEEHLQHLEPAGVEGPRGEVVLQVEQPQHLPAVPDGRAQHRAHPVAQDVRIARARAPPRRHRPAARGCPSCSTWWTMAWQSASLSARLRPGRDSGRLAAAHLARGLDEELLASPQHQRAALGARALHDDVDEVGDELGEQDLAGDGLRGLHRRGHVERLGDDSERGRVRGAAPFGWLGVLVVVPRGLPSQRRRALP